MKKTILLLEFLAILLLLILLALPVEANGCRAVVVKKNVVTKQAVVVEKVVAAAVVTPLVVEKVVVPFYSTYFNPYLPPSPTAFPSAPPATMGAERDSLAEVLRGLTGEVRNISERMTKVELKLGVPAPKDPPRDPPKDPFNPPQGQQAPEQGDLLVLTQQHCSRCHDTANAQGMGKGFVLTQGGKLRDLAPQDLGLMISKVSSGEMPKGGKMTEHERLRMIALLVKQ